MTPTPNPTAPTRPPEARRFVRYLGTEHGHEARSAHQQTVDAMRAIARRHSDLWRFVDLSDKPAGTD